MRLNGWQRIGVILSAAWMLLAAGRGALEYLHPSEEPNYLDDSVKVQVPVAKKDIGQPGRWLSDEEFGLGQPGRLLTDKEVGIPDVYSYRIERNFRVDHLLVAILAPVILFWGFAYACIFLLRWVLAGFNKNST